MAKKRSRRRKRTRKKRAPATTLIVIDKHNQVAEPDPASTAPKGHIVFVIQNDYDAPRYVMIPLVGFEPTNGGPEDPFAPSNDSVRVPKHDVRTLTFQAQSAGHFGKGSWTYEYRILWGASRSSRKRKLDPQIEINNN
jgi:hypothetical protein